MSYGLSVFCGKCKYPPAEPGALGIEPLKAAEFGAAEAPRGWHYNACVSQLKMRDLDKASAFSARAPILARWVTIVAAASSRRLGPGMHRTGFVPYTVCIRLTGRNLNRAAPCDP